MTERDPSYSWAEAQGDEQWAPAARGVAARAACKTARLLWPEVFVSAPRIVPLSCEELDRRLRWFKPWEATGAAPYRRDRGKERG